MLDKRVGFVSFEDESIHRAGSLVDRTTVRAAEPFTSAYPQAWGAEVLVTLESGETLVRSREHAKGDPEAPMSRVEMTAKAEELLRIGGVAKPDGLIANVLGMARGGLVPDILGG